MIINFLIIIQVYFMINIRSAKQMDLARIETIYNYIHDEEVGIVPCVFNGIPDVQLVCLDKYRLI